MSIDDIEDAFPLTAVQQGMLFHCLEAPDTDVYVSYIRMTINGTVKQEMLQKAWESVYQKHQTLRASFVWEGLDEPLQLIHPQVSLPWTNLNWDSDDVRDGRETDRNEQINQVIGDERQIPFDLALAPLSRFVLIKHSSHQWTLVWTIHHILADGWSTPKILNDVVDAYSALETNTPDLKPAKFSFGEYVDWLGAQDLVGATDHWKGYLHGAAPTPLKLPGIGQSNRLLPQHDSIAYEQMLFRANDTRAITTFCRQNRLTLSTLVNGAWALLLSVYCDTDSPLFGVTVSGRAVGPDHIEDAVGLFLNTVPLYVKIQNDESVLTGLYALQRQVQINTEYDFTPLPLIQSLVPGVSTREALFESLVVVESHANDVIFGDTSQSFQISDIDYVTRSHYPLALLIMPGASTELKLVYDSSKYQADNIQKMLLELTRLVQNIIVDSGLTPPLLLAKTLNVKQLWEKGRGNRSVSSPFNRLHRWFESTCDKQPNSIALIDTSGSMSFRELDEESNRVANMLLDLSKGSPSVVGILLEKGMHAIVSILGVLKSGGSYLPLDSRLPEAKMCDLVNDVAQFVLTNSSLSSKLESCKVPGLLISESEPYSTRRPVVPSSDTNELAYLMYTSGSTGQAKAVSISHENVCYSTQARIEYYKQPNPVFLMLSVLTFDSSVAGIYWVLCGGGTLVLPDSGTESDLHAMSEMMINHDVSHTLCLPSLYRLLLHNETFKKASSLRTVVVAGEPCDRSVVDLHFQQQQTYSLYNEYGPTEACVWSTVYQCCADDTDPVPIGSAIGDSLVIVLDRNLQPCVSGIEGEIYIGGRGVADGYFRQPDLTRRAFLPNPTEDTERPLLYRTGDLGYTCPDGEIVFTGRSDRQVKVRGHRIEPGEIESVLNSYPGINESIVLQREWGGGLKRRIGNLDNSQLPSNDTLVELLELLPADVANRMLDEVESTSGADADDISARVSQ